ncbi:MAG: glutaredoxin domain-containing protein [Thermodesulfovibrio sp.]|nr:conjugal transfer protein TraF [Thermodesulfovibrio sp.]MDW7997959.1 glutaredoxin domain-containing protein [Thermodesulfovibrio sp.]
MKNKICIILVLIFIFSLIFSIKSSIAENKKSVILYFFWAEGCPYCEKQKKFLDTLKKKYPRLEIKDYEVYYTPASRELLMTMAKSYGIKPTGVPVTFIGDKSFIGFDQEIAISIEQILKSCLKKVCEDPLFYKKY